MYRVLVAGVFGLFLISCTPTDIYTDVSFDRSVDFQSEKSYRWVAQNIQAHAPGNYAIRPEFLVEIKEHIEKELAKKGYKQTSNPRFLVNFAIGDAQKIRSQPGRSSAGNITTYTDSVLVIDMTDTSTKRSVWRSWTSVSLQTEWDRLAAAKSAVDTVLSRFPPN